MQRYSGTVPSAARRWYAEQTAHKLFRLEQGILDTAFGHVVCSERERDQLHKLQPRARIAVVENGVDVEYFSGAAAKSPSSAIGTNGDPHLVFVGTMDYYPNVEAATSFVRNIWPKLRHLHPNLQLLIVGAKPTAEVQALGSCAWREGNGHRGRCPPLLRQRVGGHRAFAHWWWNTAEDPGSHGSGCSSDLHAH